MLNIIKSYTVCQIVQIMDMPEGPDMTLLDLPPEARGQYHNSNGTTPKTSGQGAKLPWSSSNFHLPPEKRHHSFQFLRWISTQSVVPHPPTTNVSNVRDQRAFLAHRYGVKTLEANLWHRTSCACHNINQNRTSCFISVEGEAHSVASTCPIPDGLSHQGTDRFHRASEKVEDPTSSDPVTTRNITCLVGDPC